MVTITLGELLEQKRQYAETWPGGTAVMPRGAFLAYRHLLSEIRTAGKRPQGVLPGMDMDPVPPEGQGAMKLWEAEAR